ncbi:hypothetical protein PtA15_6A301 [Puccinia triticina]|uniref:Uncharacterized protein n=1 Tax=Puccinia triticina TaxID=208348 RepID=A0ABY7CKC2_9BASI|nr:uncharacterized protein PtA15_6A301 [Puccinia triticina]WAQ85673.1 hypothetical protein PtA15_6A301 [Puccinia triticina]
MSDNPSRVLCPETQFDEAEHLERPPPVASVAVDYLLWVRNLKESDYPHCKVLTPGRTWTVITPHGRPGNFLREALARGDLKWQAFLSGHARYGPNVLIDRQAEFNAFAEASYDLWPNQCLIKAIMWKPVEPKDKPADASPATRARPGDTNEGAVRPGPALATSTAVQPARGSKGCPAKEAKPLDGTEGVTQPVPALTTSKAVQPATGCKSLLGSPAKKTQPGSASEGQKQPLLTLSAAKAIDVFKASPAKRAHPGDAIDATRPAPVKHIRRAAKPPMEVKDVLPGPRGEGPRADSEIQEIEFLSGPAPARGAGSSPMAPVESLIDPQMPLGPEPENLEAISMKTFLAQARIKRGDKWTHH